jgi:tetratricopeptide (TPR) repeat protein
MHREDAQAAGPPDAAGHARLLKEALVYLQRREPHMASHVLRRALELQPEDPFCLSYLGLCMTMIDRRSREALELCERAVKDGCYDALLYCNLGKVHVLRGSRGKAYAAFRSGLKVNPRSRDILRELQDMGARQHAVFPFLRRGHAANRLAGRIRHILRRLLG